MFARNVSIKLKPNTLNDFSQAFEKEVVPMLRKQAGFRDEIALASDDGIQVTTISLWDSKDRADAYNTGSYPAVLKSVEKFLDGPPTVRVSNVINSTSHKLTAAAVVAA
jgi:heme-degrading monooxygenase HmoA